MAEDCVAMRLQEQPVNISVHRQARRDAMFERTSVTLVFKETGFSYRVSIMCLLVC